ncbi:MAG: DUF4238 domain-containing protein [Deltaproteobacteria bacterium]|nr:DUF4238 domain-containing protein [Deltaproteobacteria bacterium]
MPVMYLERFGKRSSSKATPRVHVIDRTSSESTGRTAGVRDVAAEVDFYRMKAADPAHDYDGEHLMGVFETAAGPAFRALDRQKRSLLDEIDRFHLSAFMALQFVRGPDSVRFSEQILTRITLMAAHVYAANDEALSALVKDMGDEPTAEAVAEARQALARVDHNMRVVPDRGSVVRNMFQSAEEFVRYFFMRRWTILRSRSPFVTCDRPIVLYQAPETRRTGVGVGLATADVILYPVDRYCALAMRHPAQDHKEGVVDVSAEQVAALNKSIAHSADRWVFHHPDDAPFATSPLPGRTPPRG